MANAREARYHRQLRMLEAHNAPLISFTMNIAGPQKTSPLIYAGFRLARERILYQLSVLGTPPLEECLTNAETGYEMLLSVDGNAFELKTMTTRLEEEATIGRLWDIDILDQNGQKLERTSPRKCLLCQRDAALCARSRTHTAGELFIKAESILRQYFEEDASEHIAQAAIRALLYELLVTPKPGLVDRVNNGAHADMDVFTFASSASALFPYYQACARQGMEMESKRDLMANLRARGLEAERRMLIATQGVNTHKGAIFALGILCAAAGSLLAHGCQALPKALSNACIAIAKPSLEDEMARLKTQTPRTAGEKIYQQTGMQGARGEAAKGYPTAVRACEALESAQARGKGINECGVEALLGILTQAEDSNFVKRSSPQRRQEWVSRMQNVGPHNVVETAAILDQDFIAENISPGGSADLLAVAFFMRFAHELDVVPAVTPAVPICDA